MSPLLELRGVSVAYERGGTRRLRRDSRVRAVQDVNLTIGHGETVAIVGESGAGKSTVARACVRLVPLESGSVLIEGRDIAALSERELRPVRRQVPLVFQDPYSSLDPSMTVERLLAEAYEHEGLSKRERRARAVELLALVGLAAGDVDRYPAEFSGGQRQRIAIARAVGASPRLAIFDEAVSSLDVTTQNQIIALLHSLRERLGLSYLFVSHDLAVVRNVAERVAVMYCGQIVELGTTEQIFSAPRHPYTEALLAAVPVIGRRRDQSRKVRLHGDPANPADPPDGCRFHPRCPVAMDECRHTSVELFSEGPRTVRCLLARDALTALSDGPPDR